MLALVGGASPITKFCQTSHVGFMGSFENKSPGGRLNNVLLCGTGPLKMTK